MISLAENCDESGLEWVTNCGVEGLHRWAGDSCVVMGPAMETGNYSSLELQRMGMVGLYRVKERSRTDAVYICDLLGGSGSGMVQYAPGIAYNPRVISPAVVPADPCAEAKAAFADGEAQVRSPVDGWFDWRKAWIPPNFTRNPSVYRKPEPDEPTTEPSVLQEHANLIAKLDEAEGLQDLQSRQPKIGDRVSRIDADGGWWGDFGYFKPAGGGFGIAFETGKHPEIATITQKPAEPEPKPKCSCPCHDPGSSVMHFRPCCSEEPPKPQAPDGVFEVAPMGRNPRGWGI